MVFISSSSSSSSTSAGTNIVQDVAG
jgi:hypothetical protein